MPISTFTGLQTALRGILAHQQAIDTTSHNVANANTEGYSRQEAVMAPSQALDLYGLRVSGRGQMGPAMKAAQAAVAGRAEGGRVAAEVRKQLG